MEEQFGFESREVVGRIGQ